MLIFPFCFLCRVLSNNKATATTENFDFFFEERRLHTFLWILRPVWSLWSFLDASRAKSTSYPAHTSPLFDFAHNSPKSNVLIFHNSPCNVGTYVRTKTVISVATLHNWKLTLIEGSRLVVFQENAAHVGTQPYIFFHHFSGHAKGNSTNCFVTIRVNVLRDCYIYARVCFRELYNSRTIIPTFRFGRVLKAVAQTNFRSDDYLLK